MSDNHYKEVTFINTFDITWDATRSLEKGKLYSLNAVSGHIIGRSWMYLCYGKEPGDIVHVSIYEPLLFLKAEQLRPASFTLRWTFLYKDKLVYKDGIKESLFKKFGAL